MTIANQDNDESAGHALIHALNGIGGLQVLCVAPRKSFAFINKPAENEFRFCSQLAIGWSLYSRDR
jgi:hypothetical protein